MYNWIDIVREDLNQEDGMIITTLTKFTSILYKGVVFLAVPICLFFLFQIF